MFIFKKILYHFGLIDSEGGLYRLPGFLLPLGHLLACLFVRQSIMRVSNYKILWVYPSSLKPRRKEWSFKRVELAAQKFIKNETPPPLLISWDRKIIDGHARWQAAKILGKKIPIIMLDEEKTDFILGGGVLRLETIKGRK